MALQKEFGVSIPPAKAIELINIVSIKVFLSKQGIQ